MTSQPESRIMCTELEELVGQVPLERLTLFSVTRMQDMLPILSKFWKERIKMFLLNFVIWHHVVVGSGMGRGRRQWGSGSSGRDVRFSGRNDSPYGGRGSSGGRGSWGAPTSPDRQDKYGSGSFGHDSNATGSFHQKSFHESMMAASNNRDRSRSRSPNRNSDWANQNSSAEKFGGGATSQRSFHETMMAAAQSIKSDAAAMQSGNGP